MATATSVTIIAHPGATVNIAMPATQDIVPKVERKDDVERYAAHKRASVAVSRRIAAHLRATHQVSRAEQVEDCGSSLTMRAYHDPDHTRKLRRINACHHPLCLMCSWRWSLVWGDIIARALQAAADDGAMLYHLVLTVPSTPQIHTADISCVRQHAISYIRRHLHAASYIVAIEITCRDAGYHPHIHAIVDVPGGWDVDVRSIAALRAAWASYAAPERDYLMCGLWPLRDADKGARELAKYIVSLDANALPTADIGMLCDAVKGVRKISSAGRLRELIAAAKRSSRRELVTTAHELTQYGYTDELYRWLGGRYERD